MDASATDSRVVQVQSSPSEGNGDADADPQMQGAQARVDQMWIVLFTARCRRPAIICFPWPRALKHDHELVTAVARDDVVLADGSTEDFAQIDQHLVALLMPGCR